MSKASYATKTPRAGLPELFRDIRAMITAHGLNPKHVAMKTGYREIGAILSGDRITVSVATEKRLREWLASQRDRHNKNPVAAPLGGITTDKTEGKKGEQLLLISGEKPTPDITREMYQEKVRECYKLQHEVARLRKQLDFMQKAARDSAEQLAEMAQVVAGIQKQRAEAINIVIERQQEAEG